MKTMGERKNRSSAMVIIVIAVLIVSFIIWSMWATLDQTSHARGQVMAEGRNLVVQSLDGGEITDIKVREGQKVKRGELLVVLDKVKLVASTEEGRARVAALKSAMARINAELLNKPLSFPPEVMAFPQFVNNQKVLYAERRAALNAELSGIASQKALVDEEMKLNEPLVGKGDVAQSEIIRMRRQSTELSTQQSVRKGRYLQDLQAEYTKTQEDLVTAEQILTQREDALKNAELRAPADGIVKNVRLTTVGGVLRPGDEVMTIVPTGEELIVEAKVMPQDIAFVKVGQLATVKFDSYDSSIYGNATGKVSYIAPDTTADQSPDGRPSLPYYRVHLTVDISGLKPRPGEKIEIQPGMTTTADITTGQHTVWRYLTKPITKTFGEAMTER